ncbi:hypothetical protein FB45DRAFT_916703 [Roridomyces roridus]|uniref:Uncharacterized protein n=1 Tax=Roridomyces roridus TaxID=1738132 RepID=A0AAD7BU76_9AGAR|nr:hypothetical protein FB45DRAFT_916703 [Roridomyces roridus]
MSSPSFTIPIPVKRGAQRTVKLLGFGFKSLLVTKVPGKLLLRRKEATPVAPDRADILPYNATPPKPDPTAPPLAAAAPAVKSGYQTYFPDHGEPENIHATLVSAGIKVRDFAYSPNRAGHNNPTHPQPLAPVPNPETPAAENLFYPVEQSPMPSVSTEWTEPHPCLRPIPKSLWKGGKLHVPTLDKPYIPKYDTHRIPGWFDQANSLLQVEYRLSENPRCNPIPGVITRRLLTLSPNLVDLSRYNKMDLEELHRYDRAVVWRLTLGIEPHPWRTMHNPHWVPSPENLVAMRAESDKGKASVDKQLQRMFLSCRSQDAAAAKCREEDELCKYRLQNSREKRHLDKDANDWDKVDEQWLTPRQRLTAWEKYKDANPADPQNAQYSYHLNRMRQHDREKAGDVDVDEPPRSRLPPPPFLQGDHQYDVYPFALWGWNAPWTGYRLLTGTPTGKTVHQYAAELSRCTESDRPASAFPKPSKPRDYVIHPGGTFVYRTKRKWVPVDLGDDSDEEGERPDVPEDDDEEDESKVVKIVVTKDDEDLAHVKAAADVEAETTRKRGIKEVEAEPSTSEPPAKRVKFDVGTEAASPARKRGIEEVGEGGLVETPESPTKRVKV